MARFVLQRVKLHDSLSFPEELDMSKFVGAETGECLYELTAVFMHTGSAHAGHYFVYIRCVVETFCWSPENLVCSQALTPPHPTVIV